jgi:O-antigen ligase
LSNSLIESSISNLERTALLNAAIDQILINPLFGIGINNFNNYAQNVLNYSFRSSNMSPHNLLIELTAEAGILGAIIFLTPILRLIKISFKKKNDETQLLLLFTIFFFLFNTFSGLSRSFFAILISSVIFYSVDNRKKNELHL